MAALVSFVRQISVKLSQPLSSIACVQIKQRKNNVNTARTYDLATYCAVQYVVARKGCRDSELSARELQAVAL